jgi:AbrB family looped-hinge helix DNA binding protein
MEHTGIIRRIDDLGRIVIPKEIRRAMGFSEYQPLEIFAESQSECIVLKKHNDMLSLAQYIENLRRFIEDGYYTSGNAVLEKVAEIEAILKTENERKD